MQESDKPDPPSGAVTTESRSAGLLPLFIAATGTAAALVQLKGAAPFIAAGIALLAVIGGAIVKKIEKRGSKRILPLQITIPLLVAALVVGGLVGSRIKGRASSTIKERASTAVETYESMANRDFFLDAGERDGDPPVHIHKSDGSPRSQRWRIEVIQIEPKVIMLESMDEPGFFLDAGIPGGKPGVHIRDSNDPNASPRHRQWGVIVVQAQPERIVVLESMGNPGFFLDAGERDGDPPVHIHDSNGSLRHRRWKVLRVRE